MISIILKTYLKKPQKLAMAIASCAYVLASVHVAYAEQIRGKSIASIQTLKPEQRNGSSLDTVSNPVDNKKSSIAKIYNIALFNPSIKNEMIEKYTSINRTYEIKQAYHLNTLYDQIRYYEANKELMNWILQETLQYHLQHTLKNRLEESAKKEATQARTEKKPSAAEAVVAVSKIHHALTKSAFNFGEITTRFRVNIPKGNAKVALTSPFFDANLDYNLKAMSRTLGSIEQTERLSFGMSKKFDVIKASTSFNYGLVSDSINYGMNKEIVGPLSAQVHQFHNLKSQPHLETVFRLTFGTTF